MAGQCAADDDVMFAPVERLISVVEVAMFEEPADNMDIFLSSRTG
jgi:hypothetical protein